MHLFVLHLTAVRDGNGESTRQISNLDLPRSSTGRSHSLQSLQHVHTLRHLTKHDVMAVQPGAGNGGDEELGSVGVGTAVGHGEETGALVLQGEVLIGETSAVDRLTASSVTHGEVSSLQE